MGYLTTSVFTQAGVCIHGDTFVEIWKCGYLYWDLNV